MKFYHTPNYPAEYDDGQLWTMFLAQHGWWAFGFAALIGAYALVHALGEALS